MSFRNNGEPTTRLPIDPQTGPVKNFEFSDMNGNYDVEMERRAFESQGIQFINLPVTGALAWSSATFFEYLPTLEKVSESGSPAISHCASGYRSAAYMSAYFAYKQGYCTTWAISQAKRIGFTFDVSSSDAAVVAFFQAVLKC